MAEVLALRNEYRLQRKCLEINIDTCNPTKYSLEQI